ncbi:MAG: hypothetical protein V1709_11515, partial [Planctomycetota bacterium]
MNLTDYFWLPRAGRYSSVVDNNARLPIVLGDPASAYDDPLGDRWELPCINANRVSSVEVYGTDYCYSIGEIYDSTVVRIFINHQLCSTNSYAVTSSHYQGDIHITKVTFSSAFPNISQADIVTAQGWGIKEATGGTTFANNPPRMIENFLTVLSTFPSTIIDRNSFNDVAQKFPYATGAKDNLGYFGVISEDETYWNIVQ